MTHLAEIVDFLLARYADDEAVAREATAGSWEVRPYWFTSNGRSWATVSDVIDEDIDAKDAEHIARHDPARVLAECDANRRIVEDAVADVEAARRRPGWTIPDQEVDELGRRYRAGVEHEKARQLPEALDRTDRLFRLLALPYAGHPDYQPEWRL